MRYIQVCLENEKAGSLFNWLKLFTFQGVLYSNEITNQSQQQGLGNNHPNDCKYYKLYG